MKKFAVLLIALILISISTATTYATTTKMALISYDSIIYGWSELLWGALYTGSTYSDNNGVDGQTVNIYYHYPNQQWILLSSEVTRADDEWGQTGIFFKSFRPVYNVTYKAEFLGSSGYDASSTTTRTRVRAKISASGRKYRRYYRISGKVRPDKPNRQVSIYVKRKGGSWRKVATKRLNSESEYVHRYYWTREGVYYEKVTYGSDIYNAGNSSSIKRFVVFQKPASVILMERQQHDNS